MKNKVISTYLILLLIFSCLSLAAFINDRITLHKEYQLKASTPSTDLSNLEVNGHQLGESNTEVDGRIFSITCEDGEYFSSFDKGENIGDRKIKRISADFDRDGTVIDYNGVQLTSINQVKKHLGENYIEGIPFSDSIDTITYVDHENNIELVYDISMQSIDLKRINDNVYRIAATPNIQFFFIPPFMLFSLLYQIQSNYLFNPIDYIMLPLYFSLLALPAVLYFRIKDKAIKRNLLIINLILVSFVLLVVFLFLKDIMMGV